MKTALPPTTPVKPHKPDPFLRLSLAVKKLDQLINRTHQLGTFTSQLLHEDTTGPSRPSLEIDLTQSPSSHSSRMMSVSGKLSKKKEVR